MGKMTSGKETTEKKTSESIPLKPKSTIEFIRDHVHHDLKSKSYTLDQIARDCKTGNREAWDALFAQALPAIARRIKKAFIQHGRSDLAHNEEVVEEVLLCVVEKLLTTSLPDFDEADGVIRYLGRIAFSQAMQWMRDNRKDINISSGHGGVTSLDAAVAGEDGTDSKKTFKDLIKGDDPEEIERLKEMKEFLGRLMSKEAGLDKEQFLLLKVVVMFYRDLENDVIKEIAEKRRVPVEDITAEIKKLMDHLLEREKVRMRHEDLAGVAYHTVCMSEAKLRRLREKNPFEDTREWEEKLRKAKKSHEEHLKEARAIIRPTNEQVCMLLGLDTANDKVVKGISLKLFRIRERLRAKFPTECLLDRLLY